ncbi:MAG: FecR family protein [Bacteroidales bacterium]|nr:FecR family protein [Bacteroidales bacterium]MBN2818859.1 FecR family protein [Bacteroidales bacterium]
MNERRYWFLTGKYLSKNLAHDEQIELESYIEADTANKKLFESHIKLWKSFTVGQKEIDFDSLNSWHELKTRITENEKQKSEKIKHLTFWRSAVAACLLALITIGAFIIVNQKSDSVVLVTASDKQLFILPDSTEVWLNKNSRLSYNSEFGDDTRKVQLNGEAYFKVQHNPDKPFVILSNKTFTKVLGTKFNIRSYHSDSAVIVSVVQGKVQFGGMKSEKQALILTKNSTGTYLKKSEGLQKTLTETPNVLAWQTNKLVFINSTLSYVIAQLEDFYNIQINLNSPEILNCSFSGTFNNQSLDEVIKILEFTMNLTFTQNNTSCYSVSGHKCSN